MEKAVVLFSGGLDSATLLEWVKSQGFLIYALSFDYGQRHLVELEFARRYARERGISHEVVDLRAASVLLRKGSLTGEESVPHGHYEEESMKSTIVPNRNMIMISIAGGYAAVVDSTKVFYAAHKGDHVIYPDCRKEFVKALDTAMFLGNLWENNNKSIDLVAPFVDKSKADIISIGSSLGIDFKKTWSCYEGLEGVHCGECGTCVERREAFELAGVPDPTIYASVARRMTSTIKTAESGSKADR